MAKDYTKYTIHFDGKMLKGKYGKKGLAEELAKKIFTAPDIDDEKKKLFYQSAENKKWIISSTEYNTAKQNNEDAATRYFDSRFDCNDQQFHFSNQWGIGNIQYLLDSVKEIFGNLFEIAEVPADNASGENLSSQKTNINYYLLSWNPKKGAWFFGDNGNHASSGEDGYLRAVKAMAAGQSVVEPWRCINSHVVPGDKVFMIKLGDGEKGIFAAGTVETSPYTAAHENEERQYIDVKFTSISDYREKILPLSTLKQEFPEQDWSPQGSGVSIKGGYGKKLEQLWNELMDKKSGSVSSVEPMIADLKELLSASRQMILTGAPGTGKTYLAKQIAYAMTGDSKDTPEEESHIGFVQFHPSYDYTDFVEGLRPVPPKDENGSIGFERQDGIFKDFCKRALKNYLDSQKTEHQIEAEDFARNRIDAFLNDAIEQQKPFSTVYKNLFYIDSFDEDNIHIKVPNNEIKKDVVVPYGELLKIFADNLVLNKPGDVKTVFNRVHNRQSDSYLYVIYKSIRNLKEKRIAPAAGKIALQNFVFIIDEINRGDISKIFGELFYAVDPGYRGSAGKVKTQYHNLIVKTNDIYKDGFYIPPNVYIIGTMNDIDRSVESMDFAIRRRFTWKEIKAEDRISMWDGQIDPWKDEAAKRMKALNDEISLTDSLSDAFHIGPAYFLKLAAHKGRFDELWSLHIQPLLREYLRGTANQKKELERFKNAYDLELTAKTENVSEPVSTASEE